MVRIWFHAQSARRKTLAPLRHGNMVNSQFRPTHAVAAAHNIENTPKTRDTASHSNWKKEKAT